MPKQTRHQVVYSSANDLSALGRQSVDLVVTSPPYPMIEMWDKDFCNQNADIRTALDSGDGQSAFELMHCELDKLWNQLVRVVKEGGVVCINIGDATRTLKDNFQLYSSHSRIINRFVSLGFRNLPNIIWRKTTNAPNKFMGSGMMPPGAYVTLEHEYILIFRNGPKRQFRTEEMKRLRRESAYFWEERNQWFSDVWFDLRGTEQELSRDELRQRSAAFPFELAYRLINMFSVKGDLVLDPFLGTGTTVSAAMASERNSIGYEIDSGFRSCISDRLSLLTRFANTVIRNRIERHRRFIRERLEKGKQPKFVIDNLNSPCVSRQECGIIFNYLRSIDQEIENRYVVDYEHVSASNSLPLKHL